MIVPGFTGVTVYVALFLETITSLVTKALPVKLPSLAEVMADNLILSPLTFSGNTLLVTLKSCPEITTFGDETNTP